jgi:TIR domain-containing protein/trypsin-like peptidase
MTDAAETASSVSLTSKRPRAQRPSWLRVVGFAAGTAAVTTLCTLAPVSTASAQAAPSSSVSSPNDLQHAEAIIKPSVVFIQTKWTGYLVDASFEGVDVAAMLGGPDGSAGKFTVTTTSSGWVANSDGYVVAAGHAVDDQPGRYGGSGLIIQAAVDKLAKIQNSRGNPLSPSFINTILDYGYANWKVEGLDNGSPPDRIVKVFPTQAAFGVVASKPLTANVISVRSFKRGDVALLKVTSETPLPALELAPGPSPSVGTAIIAAGYPGSVSESVDPSSEPSMKDGTVSGQHTVAGVPFTEISAAVSGGMSGAAVGDMQGRVVGTVSWQPGLETQAFNFMTATSTVRDILASNGVPNTLSPADRTYRVGLTDYFAGRYHKAAKDFDQVLALEPDHAQAQAYRRLASTNFSKETVPKPKASGSRFPVPLLIGVGLLMLGLVISGVLLVRWRRRRRATATGVVNGSGGTPFTVLTPAEPAQLNTYSPDVGPAPLLPPPVEQVPQPGQPAHEQPGAGVPAQRLNGQRHEDALRCFMTYARIDKPLVNQLRAGLQQLGYKAWMDAELSGGRIWWDEILRQIRLCDAIIVVVSPALLESQASTLEREYARRLGKAILPVAVRPVRPELLPPDLAAVQMVDYSDPTAAAAFALADALAHLTASPDLPEPLPDPPPVPLSYLSDLTARVHAPSLTLDEQLALVSRLRSAIGKETEHQPAMDLLHTLQRRDDLYHEPAREIASIETAEQAAKTEALKAGSIAEAPSTAEAAAD